ncbi:MAG: hypothetical protein E6J90_39520 [Deltaproteobacteria bacterium]|nr:MAG: hypothetical protein E6J90_39520 [Deltaproteobacteria bacterium]TMQ19123.1 MAG: hypothetical protein E6J91_06745 [Deltaproteobacteria bacterium]
MSTLLHVIVTGNIGTGKTTLVQHLAGTVPGSLALPERPGLYLADLYRDPTTYAFRSQLDFTLQLLDLALTDASAEVIIQERSIFDAHDVFSRTMLEAGHITPRDFELLERIQRMTAARVRPAFLIFLEATPPVAYERMRRRADIDETMMTMDYLERLGRAYAHWYSTFSLCPKVAIATDGKSAAEVAAVAAAAILARKTGG